jgi:adenylate cyclase
VDRFSNGREIHTAILSAIKEMHSSTSTLQVAEGDLYILPFQCTEGSDGLARGTRNDLASDLDRTKRLTVHLSDEVNPAKEPGMDFLLQGELSSLSSGASLELRLERWGDGERGRAVVQEWEDVIRLEDDDEWALQESLARVAARFVRQGMREVSVRPSDDLQRNPERSDRLAHQAHDKLLRGTSKHVIACISMIRTALEANAYSPRAYSCLSEAMVRKFLMWDGDTAFLDEARDYANRSLGLDQECAEAHTSLGFAYQHSGQPTDAQREYRIAIQIDPEEWMAHSYLGALLARGGNFRYAQEHLERSVGLRPGHVGAADNLYLVHMRLGDTEAAISVAESGIQNGLEQLIKFPDDQEARTHTALLFARLGRRAEARELLEEARGKYPKDGFTNFRVACILAALGDSEDAVTELSAARDRGYFVRGELLGSTDLDILRGLPGFDDLLV